MTFPGLASTSDQTKDYTSCQKQSVTLSAYAPATPNATPPYYTVVPLSSDYKTSDTSGLNGGSSPVVQSVDWGDGAHLLLQKVATLTAFMSPSGPYDTYFTTVISQAQTSLSDLPAPRSSMQNAIIFFLSDGDATALWCAPPSRYSGQMDFTPSTPQSYSVDECHQAITAAQTAAATVNAAQVRKPGSDSVAWGSSTWTWNNSNGSGSCKTDAAPSGTAPSPRAIQCRGLRRTRTSSMPTRAEPTTTAMAGTVLPAASHLPTLRSLVWVYLRGHRRRLLHDTLAPMGHDVGEGLPQRSMTVRLRALGDT